MEDPLSAISAILVAAGHLQQHITTPSPIRVADVILCDL